MSNPRLERQIALARRYAEQRRPDAAMRICRDILRQDEHEPFALVFLARAALASGARDEALGLFRRALTAHPDDAAVTRELASAQAASGQLADAAATWTAFLGEEDSLAVGWGELGRLFRDLGETERAARCFTRAFQLDDSLLNARRDRAAPIEKRELSQNGDDLLLDYHFQCNDALARALADDAGTELPERWHRFLRRFHRREPRRFADPRQQPDYHYYEGLTARPFWDRADFPWLREVEAATDTVRAELLAAMAEDVPFEPYVRQASERAPDEWQALAGELTWSSLHLLRGNRGVEENQRRFPRTSALLERLPLARAEGHAPEVFFSLLQPGMHIPPHYGVSNTKLAIHLPLIIPDDCAIRVGGESRTWSVGECLVFDDSFLHEAWNRSDEVRAVLIFETWNPDLTDVERRCLVAIIERAEAWVRATATLNARDLRLP
jgi:aspartate beta-hydroxylase